jgi:hypothetical protein
MNSNYLQTLPPDTIKVILFDLSVQDIIHHRETNVEQNNLCK